MYFNWLMQGRLCREMDNFLCFSFIHGEQLIDRMLEYIRQYVISK